MTITVASTVSGQNEGVSLCILKLTSRSEVVFYWEMVDEIFFGDINANNFTNNT